MVLLENGDLFLFDLDSRLKTPHTLNANFKFNGTRLKCPGIMMMVPVVHEIIGG